VPAMVALLTPFHPAPRTSRDEHEPPVDALRTASGHPGPAADNLSATAFDPTPVASRESGCTARRR